MKFLLVAVLLAVAVSAVLSVPVIEEFEDAAELDDWESHGDEDDGQIVRQRRVTCDLLSVGGKISLAHSACAANCLSMGKAGGRCNGGICQCRKTTFKNLWDQRFG